MVLYILVGVLVLGKSHADQDTGSLTFLVLGPDSTSAPTIHTATPPNLEMIDIGPSVSFMDTGVVIGITQSEPIQIPATTEKMEFRNIYPEHFNFLDLKMTRDSEGRLWTTSGWWDQEVHIYQDGSWKRLTLPSDFQVTHGYHRDSEGSIWFKGHSNRALEHVVFSARGDSLTTYSGFSQAGYDLTDVVPGTNQSIWIVESPDLSALHFDGLEWRRHAPLSHLPHSYYVQLDHAAVDDFGKLWLVINYREAEHQEDIRRWGEGDPYDVFPLVSYDGLEWRGYRIADGTGEPFARASYTSGVSTMASDSGGSLWIADSHRLLRLGASGWEVHRHENLRPGVSSGLVPERPGRIWFRNHAPFYYGWVAFEDGKLHRATEPPADLVVGLVIGFHYDSGVMWGVGPGMLVQWRLPLLPTSIASASSEPSPRSRLLPNYPNPFNSGTTVGFWLDQAQPISLIIYNSIGQKVRTLVDGIHSRGAHYAHWDGRGDNGLRVASGVYPFRLLLSDRTFAGVFTMVQ